MNKFNVMIVDDEPLARLNIRVALEKHKNWVVMAELSSADELLLLLKKQQPDVVFLDIQMPGISGIEAADLVMQYDRPPLIIFVTAYDNFAVNAFELSAVDYLLKPFDDERFAVSILRAEENLQKAKSLQSMSVQHANKLNQNKPLETLLIRSVGSIRIISLDDVFWFVSSGNYIEVHHQEGIHLHRVSLSHLSARLDPQVFCRVHRSAIVKLSAIREVKTTDDNSHMLVLFEGTTIKVSPAYKEKLFKKIGI